MTDTTEMVERVAKAVMWQMYPNGEGRHGPDEEAYNIARAAIEAMREPTEEMRNRAKGMSGLSTSSRIECWQDMIDAALKNKKENP